MQSGGADSFLHAVRISIADGVGKVVILVDEKINFLTGTFAFMIKIIQLIDGSLFLVQFFLDALRQIRCIYIAKIVETDFAMRIQSFAVVAQRRS